MDITGIHMMKMQEIHSKIDDLTYIHPHKEEIPGGTTMQLNNERDVQAHCSLLTTVLHQI
jgi:hypothetical protein